MASRVNVPLLDHFAALSDPGQQAASGVTNDVGQGRLQATHSVLAERHAISGGMTGLSPRSRSRTILHTTAHCA